MVVKIHMSNPNYGFNLVNSLFFKEKLIPIQIHFNSLLLIDPDAPSVSNKEFHFPFRYISN